MTKAEMTQDNQEPRSTVAVCTLWEGDYHKGVASLTNSLMRVGFRGTVWAGYRGVLPEWCGASDRSAARHEVTLISGIDLIFIRLDGDLHLSHYKPTWCLRVLNELDLQASGVYYFDPDIFVLTRWDFFEEWLQFGIACCEDHHLPLNPNHPIARRWQNFAQSVGFKIKHSAEATLNSGLVGVTRESNSFLTVWETVIEYGHRSFSLASDLKSGERADPFHNVDQDAFNIASLVADQPLSRTGIDGMGFDRGEWLTLHATGDKPWRRRVFRDLIAKGAVPDRALRLYWRFADGPLRAERASRVQSHRWLIPLVAFLGRFYRRG
jgi:hypothetical protein